METKLKYCRRIDGTSYEMSVDEMPNILLRKLFGAKKRNSVYVGSLSNWKQYPTGQNCDTACNRTLDDIFSEFTLKREIDRLPEMVHRIQDDARGLLY